jgi:uncharacterized protein
MKGKIQHFLLESWGFTRRAMRNPLLIPRYMVLGIIRGYQKTFSPDHGLAQIFYPIGVCKFRPTCSEYAYQAVEKFGIIRGLWMANWRIWRCNPWSKGGYDPVVKDRSARQLNHQ